MKTSRGMSIVGILVSLAVLSVASAILMSVYEGMGRIIQRANLQRETDNLQRYVQDVLSTPSLCRNALRQAVGPATAKLVWQYTVDSEIPVPVIQLYNPVSGAAPYSLASSLTTPNPSNSNLPYNQVANGLFIDEIRLRSRDNNGDGIPDVPVPTPVIDEGRTYTAIPAEIIITFRGPVDGLGNPIPGTQWVGASFRPRAIPIIAVLNQLNNEVEKCDVLTAANNFICTIAQAQLDKGIVCPSTGCVNGVTMAYLEGFNSNNQPICNCREICP